MPFYIDSSALVKLVIVETGSDALRAWLSDFGGLLVSSEMTRVEILRAVRRQAPQLIFQAQEALGRTPLMALTARILEDAGLLDPISLRSLDALHLASALSLGDELDGLVTYDIRLADAASHLGIHAFGPA